MAVADLASSVDRFLRAADQFFSSFGGVSLGYVAAALALSLGLQLARGHAWANALRATYPTSKVSELRVVAAFLVGAGMNGVLPARGGDALKIVLAKRSIPGSGYLAVISSFVVLAPFDTAAGVLVLLYAISQGLLPAVPRIEDLPAFDISFWAANPAAFVATVIGIVLAAILLYRLASRRIEQARAELAHGVVILRSPRRYLREVVLWQGIGWGLRFASFWLFLDAFGIGGSTETVLLVMSVQSVSNFLPFTPGGAGAQQALLVASLPGPPRTLVLAYSVGQQIIVAAFSLVVSVLALLVVFRTTGWRGLLSEGRAARESASAA